MKHFDYVIVGSGINSLVCAAMLSLKGKKVCLIERNDRLGGCLRTEEITLPGFRHEVLAGFYPLFVTSPAYASLRPHLDDLGIRFHANDKPTGVVTPDDRSLVLSTSLSDNVTRFNALSAGDGDRFAQALLPEASLTPVLGALLDNEPRSLAALTGVAKALLRSGPKHMLARAGRMTESARDWLETTFDADLLQALLAPWLLHMGLRPDDAGSGQMLRLNASLIQGAGLPLVIGGGVKLVAAFQKLIEMHDGACLLNAHVSKVVLDGASAVGVALDDGTQHFAREGVICNTTPTQLYGSLLPARSLRADTLEDTRRFRYGLSDMQIHLALDAPVRWRCEALNDVAMVHVTSGIDAVSRAVNEASRGLLPAEPTIVVAQPVGLDPSRVPAGRSLLWIQLQELPAVVKGDAAGSIHVDAPDAWSERLREAYADRVVDMLALRLPGLKVRVIKRTVLSPRDLSRLNINLVGGDPYSGACTIGQSLAWRPLASGNGHKTEFKRLYHIGASTHPGPGVGGMSGFMLAKSLTA